MTRHSRNSTANSVYTYHEKQKDAKASGFGSLKARFSKDGVKDFDCCSINLHPCKFPLISPDGYLFDKEALLEYIIAKKVEISKAQKEYQRQCDKDKNEMEELMKAEERSKTEKFIQHEKGVSTKSVTASRTETSQPGPSKANMDDKKLPSFWIPSLTPSSKVNKCQKPDKKVYCPISGKVLKMKDMITVKFTPADNGEASVELKRNRYKCPVTGDLLGNNIPCAVLKPTGDVVTMQCVDLIRKDMLHPITGQKLKESDIIVMQRGGTGFASVNQDVVAVKARPVMHT